MKKILKLIFEIGLLFVLLVIGLVRFTGLKVHIKDHLVLDYIEEDGSFVFFGGHKDNYQRYNGIDGPYIINNQIIRVNENNEMSSELLKNDELEVNVKNANQDSFVVKLNASPVIHKAIYPLPEKLIAISDIEGNFTAFKGFLLKNKVIDENFSWIFGSGHLVLLGDFVDRGDNVIPVLWLIHKLEQEAKQRGGQVHFILGNHEIMNIQGNSRNAKSRYKKLAQDLGNFNDLKSNYKILFSKDSYLGNWLRSKNIIERIGPYLFVHAGLSPDVLELKLELNEINSIARQNIDSNFYHNPGFNEKANFIMGRKGPFWYRGLAMDYKYYNKIKESGFLAILHQYNSKFVIIGHTVVENVSLDFKGKLINIDVKHGKENFSSKTQGLLIERGGLFKIDAIGGLQELNTGINVSIRN